MNQSSHALQQLLLRCMLHMQVKPDSIRVAARTATGGASGVGASVADYVIESNADMVVLGSRGLHGWQR
jgi:nucleotide-binding universal stress UspA family protein